MSLERQFLLHLVHNPGEIKTALEAGVSREDFYDESLKKMFVKLQSDYSRLGSFGGHTYAKKAFPNLFIENEPYETGMTTPHYFQELRKERIAREIYSMAENVVKDTKLADDPKATLSRLHTKVTELTRLDTSICVDTSLYSVLGTTISKYCDAQDGISYGLYPWPWEALQDATGGVREAEYAILYGRPKSKKSWVLAYLAAHALREGKKVLFYTKEMTPESMGARVIACYLQVDATELRKGQLTEENERRLFDMKDNYPATRDNFIFLSAQDVDGYDTPAWLRGRIDTWKPDVVFVDGVYLMTPDSMKPKMQLNEKCAEISQSLRAIQLATKVPFVCTLQANRKAAGHDEANFDELALSDGFSRDCTMALRVIAEKGPHQTVVLKVAGIREGEAINGFRINARCAQDFSYVGMVTDNELADAEDNDNKVEETGPKPPTSTKKTIIRRKEAPDVKSSDAAKAQLFKMIDSKIPHLKASNG